MNIIDELNDNELNSSGQIEAFCRDLNSVCRDLYDVTYYGAEIIYANLANLPGPLARIKAKAVSSVLMKCAEAIHLAGSLAVRSHRTFIQRYAEELSKAKGPKVRKPFKFGE